MYYADFTDEIDELPADCSMTSCDQRLRMLVDLRRAREVVRLGAHSLRWRTTSANADEKGRTHD